jgi:hypothetical protein
LKRQLVRRVLGLRRGDAVPCDIGGFVGAGKDAVGDMLFGHPRRLAAEWPAAHIEMQVIAMIGIIVGTQHRVEPSACRRSHRA